MREPLLFALWASARSSLGGAFDGASARGLRAPALPPFAPLSAGLLTAPSLRAVRMKRPIDAIELSDDDDVDDQMVGGDDDKMDEDEEDDE